MKRFFPFCLLTAALCLSSATAFAAEAVSVAAEETTATAKEMVADPWFIRHSFIISVLLLVLLVCMIIRWRRRPLEIFTNENGKIHVSPGALSDLVANAAIQYGAVSRPSARFEKRGGLMHVYVWLKLGPGQRLPQFSNGLQTQIAASLREAFGIETIGGVHIIITGFKGGQLPPEEASSVPYHGAGPAKRAPAAPPRTDGDYFGSQ